MAQNIARDPASAESIYCWWDGTRLDRGDHLTVGADECALVIDGTEVVSLFGPGRHLLDAAHAKELAPYLGKPDTGVEVCFLTTAPIPGFAIEGEIGTIKHPETGLMTSATLEAELTVQIKNPARYLALALAAENEPDDPETAADEDDEEQTGLDMVESWIAQKVLEAAVASVDRIAAGREAYLGATVRRVTPQLAEAGVEIVAATHWNLALGDDEAAPAEPAEAPPAQAGATSAAGTSARFCGGCGQPRGGQDAFCGNCGQRF